MRKILIVLLLIIVASGATFYFLYNKPHRNPASEKGIRISSKELFDQFSKDEVTSNTQYLDKVLEVSGKVLEIEENQNQTTVIILETNDPIFGVRCTMNSKVAIDIADFVTVKGICTGYLSDVVLTNASLTKNDKHE